MTGRARALRAAARSCTALTLAALLLGLCSLDSTLLTR